MAALIGTVWLYACLGEKPRPTQPAKAASKAQVWPAELVLPSNSICMTGSRDALYLQSQGPRGDLKAFNRDGSLRWNAYSEQLPSEHTDEGDPIRYPSVRLLYSQADGGRLLCIGNDHAPFINALRPEDGKQLAQSGYAGELSCCGICTVAGHEILFVVAEEAVTFFDPATLSISASYPVFGGMPWLSAAQYDPPHSRLLVALGGTNELAVYDLAWESETLKVSERKAKTGLKPQTAVPVGVNNTIAVVCDGKICVHDGLSLALRCTKPGQSMPSEARLQGAYLLVLTEFDYEAFAQKRAEQGLLGCYRIDGTPVSKAILENRAPYAFLNSSDPQKVHCLDGGPSGIGTMEPPPEVFDIPSAILTFALPGLQEEKVVELPGRLQISYWQDPLTNNIFVAAEKRVGEQYETHVIEVNL